MFWGIIGQIIYVISYPVLFMILRGSKRAYVIIIFESKVLVTKNWLGFNRTWRLPGGGAKTGESYLQTAIREVKEEVGIDLSRNNIKQIGEPVKHKKGFYFQTFITELTVAPRIVAEFPEIWKAEFVDINLLRDDEINLQLKDAISKLGKNT